jgi:hypothetical protein
MNISLRRFRVVDVEIGTISELLKWEILYTHRFNK